MRLSLNDCNSCQLPIAVQRPMRTRPIVISWSLVVGLSLRHSVNLLSIPGSQTSTTLSDLDKPRTSSEKLPSQDTLHFYLMFNTKDTYTLSTEQDAMEVHLKIFHQISATPRLTCLLQVRSHLEQLALDRTPVGKLRAESGWSRCWIIQIDQRF